MSDHYIEFSDVSKSFDDHLVLDHVSFVVDPGETCVIMGRSGVGKSVTLKHIMGFLKPDEGRVIVAGEDITDWPEARLMQIRRRVTMVFQSGALFDSLTVAENIAFPLTDGVGFETDQIDARVAEVENPAERDMPHILRQGQHMFGVRQNDEQGGDTPRRLYAEQGPGRPALDLVHEYNLV